MNDSVHARPPTIACLRGPSDQNAATTGCLPGLKGGLTLIYSLPVVGFGL